ncbi:MAG TPA: Re/Si-specific NAD(P)(+) transhydrogenase subunit alpha [Acidimicrobiales bacterium]|nr:Re/Si-specific NAD(P)(+) transhydrogenase subunit alpha [Acidimicrobiales bacterium]
MRIAIPHERAPGEQRVATVPDVAKRLVDAGHTVLLESGAGAKAFFPDEEYAARGVQIVDSVAALYTGVDLVAKVQAPTLGEIGEMPDGVAVVSFFQPSADLEVVAALRDRKMTAFSLDLLPRISRAQSMDALSSQATVSGYRSVLIAAEHLPRFFPMFMTAAGTVPPAKVLVLGAGVAGLQAIATARRLGAVVRVNDVRAAAKEEVESLGAKFVELDLEAQEGAGGYARAQSDDFLARQRGLIAAEVAKADVVITTAAIPGRKAPTLVTAEMVRAMAPGSVIVDLAAESGGNCELSVAGEVVVDGGVSIYGASNVPSQMPVHASFLYARNIFEFVSLLAKDGTFAPDFDDEIIAGTCVIKLGAIVHAPTAELMGGAPA